jgi:hypothetical protein
MADEVETASNGASLKIELVVRDGDGKVVGKYSNEDGTMRKV